ncbi:MAG TPA: hypothetical protein VJL81_18295 [Solirubrobacterales bacterium]|nr:hypothetical protein [Solirubrobacterales bacterium]
MRNRGSGVSWRLALPSATVLCALALALAATAAAQPGPHRLIVSPGPGQQVRSNHLRLVVRAGPEHEDLKARLNGVAIGRRFGVEPAKRRRTLDVSPIDGLRRGRNVLKVWVRGPGGYHHATVRFDIAHHRPLASAGVDRRIVVGSRVELQGLLKLDKSDQGPRHLRWAVVAAPARSLLSLRAGTVAERSAERSAFGGRRTLSPTFRPDVRGRYKVKLTASTGNGTSTNSATVYAVPPNPLIVLKTEVPATAQEPRPGIQVGGEVLRAPWLHTSGKEGDYSGTLNGVHYEATWQIVAFDRSTMALKWNRTYGLCEKGDEAYPCVIGENGDPSWVELIKELASLGPETLVVAASHPSGAGPGAVWSDPDAYSYASNNLRGIGFPVESETLYGTQMRAATAGEMSGVGVPGISTGDAKFIIGGGQSGLNGYLTPDSNSPKHYFYVPAQRVPFDTRSARSCSAVECTVAQTVGGSVVNGTIEAGQAGFLVAGFDRHTLAPVEHQTFVTATGVNEGSGSLGGREAGNMAAYINGAAERELVVTISSIHGPNQSGAVFFTPGVAPETWERLLQSIVAIGGTREGFNAAATTVGSDYTLVGRAHLEEGAAQEAVGAGARLQGALVPNAQSVYEPLSVTRGEVPPPEKLMQIVMRAPQPTAWPLEGNAEATEAIAAIGLQCSQLGGNPRGAYWTQLTTPEIATVALEQVRKSSRPANAKFSAKAFGEAKAELEKEIEYVKAVRVYMKELAQPANQAGKIGWEEASTVAAELEERLKTLKEEGQANAEYLAVIEEALEIFSLGAEVKKYEQLANFLAGAAIAAETGQTVWDANYEGASKEPGVTVQALQLGKELRIQAEADEATFARMGDIIVSDWTKLQEVGRYGGCNPNGGACGAYEELSHNEEAEQTAAAAMKRAFDRDIYEKLVPLAFPIWNTGLTINQEAKVPNEAFECNDLSHPFWGAPQLAFHRSLWQYNPVTGMKTWRVYLSVARSERTYGWAPETMLKRMFEPVPVESSNAETGGLGMNPGGFMRQGLKIAEYVSGWSCVWDESPENQIE